MKDQQPGRNAGGHHDLSACNHSNPFVEPWFSPGYALIPAAVRWLPCIFYADYYAQLNRQRRRRDTKSGSIATLAHRQFCLYAATTPTVDQCRLL